MRGIRGSKSISVGASAAEGGLLLSGLGGTMMKDAGKIKRLSTSFVSTFPGKVYSQASQVSA